MKENNKLKISLEKLTHFNCGECKKWWSIADADENKRFWYCPWCGFKNCKTKN